MNEDYCLQNKYILSADVQRYLYSNVERITVLREVPKRLLFKTQQRQYTEKPFICWQ